jgi:hypothetical protein
MKDLYREETNHDVYADYCCERPTGSYADEYVHWLEAKLKALSQHDVSGQSEQLLFSIDEIEKIINENTILNGESFRTYFEKSN